MPAFFSAESEVVGLGTGGCAVVADHRDERVVVLAAVLEVVNDPANLFICLVDYRCVGGHPVGQILLLEGGQGLPFRCAIQPPGFHAFVDETEFSHPLDTFGSNFYEVLIHVHV